MESKKIKNIEAIVIIILVVLLLGVLVFLGIKIFVDSSEQNLNNPNNDIGEIEKTNNDETNVDNNGTEEPDDKEQEGNDVEEENTSDKEEQSNTTIDPYAKYTNMTWAKKESGDASIKNNKLYVNEERITGISGTLKSVVHVWATNEQQIIMQEFYILTEEGTAWLVNGMSKKTTEQILSNYKIIDMVALQTYTGKFGTKTVYFLTEDGELIDKNGVKYDKYNFTNSYFDTSLEIDIPLDKNNVAYCYNEKDNTYSAIVNKSGGTKLEVAKMFILNELSDRKLIICTTDNKLFECAIGSNKAAQVSGTVKSVEKIDENAIVIVFKDKTLKIYSRFWNGYDVENKKQIKISGLTTYVESDYNSLPISQVTSIATVAWADEYVAGGKDLNSLENAVMNALREKRVDLSKYIITVTEKGVSVKEKYEVSDYIKEISPNANPVKKGNYKLDMVLPYFKVETKVTKEINSQIKEIYDNYLDAYLSEESLKISGRNTKISYTANMNKDTGILTLKVTVAYSDWQGTGPESDSSTITYKYDCINDKNKTESTSIQVAKDILAAFEEVSQDLADISEAVQSQITASYDGKTMTGIDVISAVQLYENSTDVSIRIIVSEDKQFETGKYSVKISDDVLKTLTSVKKGGIFVSPTQTSGYVASRKDSLDTIKGEVNNTQTYYSYIMKDTTTGMTIGVLFVRKGAIN